MRMCVRAILIHMGLQHKMNHNQAAKKWENLRKKYKELKYPPDGVKVFTALWPFFALMDEAMDGRLEGSTPVVETCAKDENNFLPISKPKRKRVSLVMSSPMVADEPEVEVTLNGDVEGPEEVVLERSQEIERIMQEVEDERSMIDYEKQVMERERQVMERERLVLQRVRTLLDWEIATVDRDRASLERERAVIEREKAVMERERAMVEKDRDAVALERLALERVRDMRGRVSASQEMTDNVTEDSSTDILDRKERFLQMFEINIDSF